MNDEAAHYIVSWENSHASSRPSFQGLAKGLDGAVRVMAVHKALLVLGGVFTRAYSNDSQPIHSGSLIAWNLSSNEWSTIGRTTCEGTVTGIVSSQGTLYIVGQFKQIQGVEVNNIAAHSGEISAPSGWRGFGAGISGRTVMALAVTGPEIFVGGNIVRAGDQKVNNIARWDGTRWERITDEDCEQMCAQGDGDSHCLERNCEVDGFVSSIVTWNRHIFVAGNFRTAGGHPVTGIAHYFSGRWSGVSGGLEGSVYDLKIHSPLDHQPHCIYVAGQIKSVVDKLGAKVPVYSNVAKTCFNDTSIITEGWEAVDSVDSSGLRPSQKQVGAVRKLLFPTPQDWTQSEA
eukprot:CAMPEP_0184297086 /NCGR_PEP_ID=MMETSP1049-20130417/8018_1 /TAXON_ID=77928 /ORGANISM="Proteomonas sulcata, Strain CCMP704" /LENGTH=344 /DNA_ID=CAMNT_0026606639 /DNA_START=9 /DNA_END=1043 /DNA_ORIENTATION=+